MNVLSELRERFRNAISGMADDPSEFTSMIRQSQNAKFGDYQANCAMPLAKRIGQPARDVAQQIVDQLDVAPFCDQPEIAGPGFVNLRLRDEWLSEQLRRASRDVERLGIDRAAEPKTYVIDYSAPNVAKPMHVGHIRSTVIGDALYRTLSFLGHNVIGDNHIGDWGTQFGMIIYGFKNFRDSERYQQSPVAELSRLYRLVNRLVDYHSACNQRADLQTRIDHAQSAIERFESEQEPPAAGDKKAAKALAARRRALQTDLQNARDELASATAKIESVEADSDLFATAKAHPEIGRGALEETARLHAGDEENRNLWNEFLPPCLEDIERIYRRLDVKFDHTLGESFYHERLQKVVDDLMRLGVAEEQGGAVFVFSDEWPAPMIIRKQDGAFLYATTDLATIQYRSETWKPNAILYVVDHRQSLHFEQLFGATRRLGYDDIELKHVSFGTVLGDDGKPFKTRSGETVGLEGLLDEAVRRAREVVSRKDEEKPSGAELSDDQKSQIAEIVGIGSLKYADLSHNRTSDYAFSYDKMLALDGNTAAYMQYAYVRVMSIFRRGGIDIQSVREGDAEILLDSPEERALGVKLLQFGEALETAMEDYRPNQLTAYLFGLANQFASFFEKCPVLAAEDESRKASRLLLCDLTARTIAKGLQLLGIGTVDYM